MGSSTLNAQGAQTIARTMLLNFAGFLVLVTLAVTGQRRFGAGHMNQMFDRMQRAQQDSYESTIPGGPGVDYPTFSVPPPTSFSCQGLVQGYYADQETDCQVYHVCGSQDAVSPISSLLCPNGTLYNQQYFVCDWWFNVDCSVTTDFFSSLKITPRLLRKLTISD